ncbi:MAG: hypothetical protein NUV86_12785 [Candidatus Scalindua sp.]|nr:hypothetical protein [Candidatus Scalindua sp.]
MEPPCKLCKKSTDLQNSHILPRFLGKYLKKTSVTGFLIAKDNKGNPHRQQDLTKIKMLCVDCERLFNKTETFFANNVFHPFKEGNLNNIPIDDKIGKFAISISLRALWIMQFIEHPIALKWNDKLEQLENNWRDYLLGNRDAIAGESTHHILLCNEKLLALGLKNNPNLIYNILRTSAFYIFEKFDNAYIFANLAGVQVVSMIYPDKLPASQGTEVYPNQTFGLIKPAGTGWGGYYQNLTEFSAKCNETLGRISKSYKNTIEHSTKNNIQKAINSEDVKILKMQQILYSCFQEESE